MENNYISQEFKAIVNDKNFSDPLNVVMASTWVLGHHKGINLKILDLKKMSAIADYFIIASATNITQAKAMADELTLQLREIGLNATSREGLKDSTEWILLDYHDFIIHIFQESARQSFDLDTLYQKGESISIPESYYFSAHTDYVETRTKTPRIGNGDKDYF